MTTTAFAAVSSPTNGTAGNGLLADLAARCLHDAYQGVRTGAIQYIHAARRSAQAFDGALDRLEDRRLAKRTAPIGASRSDRTMEALVQVGFQLTSLWNGAPTEGRATAALDREELELHAMAAHLVDVVEGSTAPDEAFLRERLRSLEAARQGAAAVCVDISQRDPSRLGETMRALKVAHLLEQAGREIIEGLAPIPVLAPSGPGAVATTAL